MHPAWLIRWLKNLCKLWSGRWRRLFQKSKRLARPVRNPVRPEVFALESREAAGCLLVLGPEVITAALMDGQADPWPPAGISDSAPSGRTVDSSEDPSAPGETHGVSVVTEISRGTAAPAFAAQQQSTALYVAAAPRGLPGDLSSLPRHSRTPYELHFLENGSLDGTAEYLSGLAAAVRVEIIRVVAPGRPAPGKENIALRGQFVALLNNDVVVTPGLPITARSWWGPSAVPGGGVQR